MLMKFARLAWLIAKTTKTRHIPEYCDSYMQFFPGIPKLHCPWRFSSWTENILFIQIWLIKINMDDVTFNESEWGVLDRQSDSVLRTGWFKKTVFYNIIMGNENILIFLLALYMDILIINVYRTVETLTKIYKQISHKVSTIEK